MSPRVHLCIQLLSGSEKGYSTFSAPLISYVNGRRKADEYRSNISVCNPGLESMAIQAVYFPCYDGILPENIRDGKWAEEND